MNILDFKENINDKDINLVIDTLNSNDIVVIPTDTVYGIGASIKSSLALEKLYKVKNRDKNNRINMLVSSKEMAKEYVTNYNEICDKLIDSFWPGALTIVFKKNENVPNIITANSDTVGIRMCDNIVTNKIIKSLGLPLAVPSANKSGRPSGTNIEDIINDFKNEISLYVDYGSSNIGIESTIVEIIDNESVKLLRKGKITKEEIEKLGIRVIESNDLENRKHYKINIKTINVDSVEKANEIITENGNKKIAIVGFEEDIRNIKIGSNIDIYNLKSVCNMEYAMKNIYVFLRQIESKKYDLCILISPERKNSSEWIIRVFKEAGK